MRVKRIKTVTMQTRQVTTVRWRSHRPVVLCKQCAGEAHMVTPGEAAVLAQTTARHIFRRVEAGEVHFLETADGELLICCNSLALVH